MVRRYEESIEVRVGEGAVSLTATRSDTATRSREMVTRLRDGATGSRDLAPGARGGRDDIDDVQSQSPSAFLWRGRLYIVRDVIGHWRERRAWWREALDPDEEVAHGPDSPEQLACLEQEVWRVEASPGRLAGTGVYDLGMNQSGMNQSGMNGPARSWRLLRVAD
jgi:hypothetical protein